MEAQRANNRTLIGEVVSTKMNHTIVVRVDRTVVHPKYGKRYVRNKKYHVDADEGEFSVGQIVKFTECRPLSKTKRWRVTK